MASWRLKSCPRCHGDILIEEEAYGYYECCLMCGYRRDLPVVYTKSTSENTGKSIKKKVSTIT